MRWVLLLLLPALYAANPWRAAMDAGNYSAAEQQLNAVLSDTESPQALADLATIYRAQARYTDAEPLLERLVATFSPDDPAAAPAMTDLAINYRATGNALKAQPLLSTVISMHRKTLGPADIEVARDLQRLAEVFVDLQQFPQAIQMFVQSIDLASAKLGRIHPDLLFALDQLGALYRDDQHYPEAEGIYRWALTIRERHVGPKNSELIPTVDNLAYVLFGQKKFKEADPFYDRLLDLWEKSVGLDHPMVAFTLDKMAEFYYAQDKISDAECAAERSLKIREAGYQQGVRRRKSAACRARLQHQQTREVPDRQSAHVLARCSHNKPCDAGANQSNTARLRNSWRFSWTGATCTFPCMQIGNEYGAIQDVIVYVANLEQKRVVAGSKLPNGEGLQFHQTMRVGEGCVRVRRGQLPSKARSDLNGMIVGVKHDLVAASCSVKECQKSICEAIRERREFHRAEHEVEPDLARSTQVEIHQ